MGRKSKRPSELPRDDSGAATDPALAAALMAAEESPDDQGAWMRLEALAADFQQPDDVGALYSRLLEAPLAKETRTRLAERSVPFFDEWFGDTPSKICDHLERICELDAGAQWAFERLARMLTSAGRWDALLAVYDRRLAVTSDDGTRRRLLEDAAQVAKDFADDGDRAVRYVQAQLALDPENGQISHSLERLLERHGRHADLVELWRTRLDRVGAEDGKEIRLRMALTLVQRLDQPEEAVLVLEAVLAENPGHLGASQQLECILASESTPLKVRQLALANVRRAHLVASRNDELMAALETALSFVGDAERRALRRDLGMRLAAAGRDLEALSHYRELLLSDAADGDARKELRAIATRAGRADVLAQALEEAADACSETELAMTTLLEAAEVRLRQLRDATGAAALYRRVMDAEARVPELALAAAHRLAELYATSNSEAQQLEVLERLARLEPSAFVRRDVELQAARLSERLGDGERAVARWRAMLAATPRDNEARGALLAHLETASRWPELIVLLRECVELAAQPFERRGHLVRIARLEEERIASPADAAATWARIGSELGYDAETLAALDRLLTQLGRHEELARLFDATAEEQQRAAAALVLRLGAVNAQIGNGRAALKWFRQVLAFEPGHAEARAGMHALLNDEEHRKDALVALAAAYELTGDWRELLNLLDQRLAVTAHAHTRARLFREAAEIHERMALDSVAALVCLGQAIAATPQDIALDAEIVRIAGANAQPLSGALAFETASTKVDEPTRKGALLECAAALYEAGGDAAHALAAASRAALAAPGALSSQRTVARLASSVGEWTCAAEASVTAMRALGKPDLAVVRCLEENATRRSEFGQLASGLEAAVVAVGLDLCRDGDEHDELAQSLDILLATWFGERAGDLRAARRPLARAVSRHPRDRATVHALLALERREGGATGATLLAIDALEPANIDALVEAAELAHAEGRDDAAAIFQLLFRKAAVMLGARVSATGTKAPADALAWTAEKLVAQHLAGGQPALAVSVLLETARHTDDAASSLALRRSAAELLAGAGESAYALEVYRSVLDAMPHDREMVAQIAALNEQHGRIAEALSLRQRELALTELLPLRLALGLTCARLGVMLEAAGGPVAALLLNLEAAPGDAASIIELRALMSSRGRHRELAEVLGKQAELLEGAGQRERAVSLHAEVAAIAQTVLRDRELALKAYGQVVALDRTAVDALDALAAVSEEAGDHAAAARWLEQRLVHAGASERVAVMLRLARTQLRAEQQEAATLSLERAFDEAPRNGEARKLLFHQYRTQGRWDELARGLSRAALATPDEATVLAYAREASAIFFDRLASPAEAVPILQRAVAIDRADRGLASKLAEGLIVSGDCDGARALLGKIIDEFGRRRSAERAQFHHQRARASQQLGLAREAIAELETASEMDGGNLEILMTLADLAQNAGDFDRAERALRTLLVTVRREQKPESLPIGGSEILFELSHLASARGQTAKAEELAESAFEALASNMHEVERIERRLMAHAHYDHLGRALDMRFARVTQPHMRARVLAQKAELYAGPLGRAAEALELRMRAVEADPGSPVHHQAALGAVRGTPNLDRYVSLVEALLSDERADASAFVRCELLLRLAEVLETERKDFAHATRVLGDARATGVRRADVCRALARVAGASGDEAEQLRLLGELASLGEDQAETRVDALYRMAEVYMASSDTIGEGLEALERATKDDFRAERAAAILRAACLAHAGRGELFEAYERVARRTDDAPILLGFLEHRALTTTVALADVEEAAALANHLGRTELAFTLMTRARELGREGGPDGLRDAGWALIGLAERELDDGELARAVALLSELAEHGDEERLFALGRRAAEQLAERQDGAALTAKLYERLLERAPGSSEAWRTLGAAYVRVGALDKLVRMVDETLDAMQDAHERNELRLLMARAIVMDSEHGERIVDVLEAVLTEDPDHDEARTLLLGHLERIGRTDAVIELLFRQLDRAEHRGDVALVKLSALKLGACLGNEDREPVLDVYRRALTTLPEDIEVIDLLLMALGDGADLRERAELVESLVRHAPAPRAAASALELARIHDELGDAAAASRALELGATRAPANSALFVELERRYREACDYTGLVATLLSAAERADGDAKVGLWLEAERVYRALIGDSARAAELLRRVAATEPTDVDMCIDLANALAESGDHPAAISSLGNALSAAADPDWRLRMLIARARLFDGCGDPDAALSDCASAFEIDSATVAAELETRLDSRRLAAQAAQDRETERLLTGRTVDILAFQSKHAAAAALLREWSARAPEDLDGLRRLRDLDRRAERWAEVRTSCERMLNAAAGADRIEPVLALAEAHRKLETLAEALVALETVHAEHPDHAGVRAELRAIYEHAGDGVKLAAMLALDAYAMAPSPERGAVLLRSGRLYVAHGDATTAVGVLASAVEDVPGDLETIVALADAYILGGWLDDSNALLDAALEANRGKRTAEVGLVFHRKAHIAGSRADHRSQLEWLVEAHACAKRNGYIAAELAYLAEQLHDWELAAKTLRTVSMLETECPISKAEAFYRQGRIALYQGDEKNARMWARRARREAPDSPEIEAFLAELGEPIAPSPAAKR
ncbi:MAG: hypothetical protein EXR75_02910 [Myxococcales bacterium]|nr:hypothetical protein [Myxococcales bacterium]